VTPLDAFTCREAFARLEDYVDRELASEELQRVDEHLKVCEMCADEFHFEGSVLSAIREKLQRFHVPEGLQERVARLIALERSRGAGNPP
jgi:anti-sigma factor (TIGR02949 family)